MASGRGLQGATSCRPRQWLWAPGRPARRRSRRQATVVRFFWAASSRAEASFWVIRPGAVGSRVGKGRVGGWPRASSRSCAHSPSVTSLQRRRTRCGRLCGARSCTPCRGGSGHSHRGAVTSRTAKRVLDWAVMSGWVARMYSWDRVAAVVCLTDLGRCLCVCTGCRSQLAAVY